MLYSEARPGRVFVIRLEHGDILHKEIERFAREHAIRAAALIVVGGGDTGSTLVVGPERGDQRPIVPMTYVLDNVHEIAGTGTLFWDQETDEPLLHMHIACGREGATRTGCVRQGVRVWQLMEIVLWELVDSSARRVLDAGLGFKVLIP
ncbi:MAG: DNA-binding protein [Anaerolineae bacterium]|nr:DNA-binding protein [Anaerolineae bacterium]